MNVLVLLPNCGRTLGLAAGTLGPRRRGLLGGGCERVGCTDIARPRFVWGGALVFVLSLSFLHIPCFLCRQTDLYYLVFLTSLPLRNAS